MSQPNFEIEQSYMDRGYSAIAGVDEVGRGPLCGPVTAAAVILDPSRIPTGLNDSKKLSAKVRDRLFNEIMDTAQVGYAHVPPQEIDELNILWASMRAMELAVAQLAVSPGFVLVDGNRVPAAFGLEAEAVVKGDGRSVSIAAASIIAKTLRDRLMQDLAKEYPQYGWDQNAGYPTKSHLEALRVHGVTPHHRRSFKPVHNILYQEK